MEILLLTGLAYGLVCGFCASWLKVPLLWMVPVGVLIVIAKIEMPWSLLLGLLLTLGLLGAALLSRLPRGISSLNTAGALGVSAVLFGGMVSYAAANGGIPAALMGMITGLCAGVLGQAQGTHLSPFLKQFRPELQWMSHTFLGVLVFTIAATATLPFAIVSVAGYGICLWLSREIVKRHPETI